MKTTILSTLFLALAMLAGGCASIPELTMYHKIKVPEQYQYGKDHYIGMSDYERYLYAYEQAYWRCMKDRSKNIDYKYKSGDLIGNGWPPAIDGTRAGYLVADRHINLLVNHHGKLKVQEYLREVTGYEYQKKADGEKKDSYTSEDDLGEILSQSESRKTAVLVMLAKMDIADVEKFLKSKEGKELSDEELAWVYWSIEKWIKQPGNIKTAADAKRVTKLVIKLERKLRKGNYSLYSGDPVRISRLLLDLAERMKEENIEGWEPLAEAVLKVLK